MSASASASGSVIVREQDGTGSERTGGAYLDERAVRGTV